MNPSRHDLTDTLRIYGNLSLLEMAPALLADEYIYAGKTLKPAWFPAVELP